MARQIENGSSLKSKVKERDTPKTHKLASAITHAFRQIRHMTQASYSPAYNAPENPRENQAKAEQRKAEAIEYLHRTAATLC